MSSCICGHRQSRHKPGCREPHCRGRCFAYRERPIPLVENVTSLDIPSPYEEYLGKPFAEPEPGVQMINPDATAPPTKPKKRVKK